MDEFVARHKAQLDQLNIPAALYENLKKQLERTFGDNGSDLDRLVTAPRANLSTARRCMLDYGDMLVIPHVCSWDIVNNSSRGFWEALNELPISVLESVLEDGLHVLWDEPDIKSYCSNRSSLVNRICDPRTWANVILYRDVKDSSIRAALPAPPYFPQVKLQSATDPTEADLTGPFPFSYYLPSTTNITIQTSLAYLSPTARIQHMPTLDLVPAYSCPDPLTRAARYVALLGKAAPPSCLVTVKNAHAAFVQRMHLIRQEQLRLQEEQAAAVVSQGEPSPSDVSSSTPDDKVWSVYTDTNDPMELAHPVAGLVSSNFTMTDSMEDADIIYSYKSLYTPGPTQDLLQGRAATKPVLINQFPYEGAFVQKDHLARELLTQHGLPRNSWAIETYDLDCQLTEFIGAAVLAEERGEDPVWIVKPAGGTQSQGHVVTRSTAHILRLLDTQSGSRVVQRYIENPVCVDGRKVDCRCIVMMTSASPGKPDLFMHNRVYFRIANKEHSIATASSLIDAESVLTATHLIGDKNRTSSDPLQTLPADHETIAKLEETYKDIGFDWQGKILPKIHTTIRELFGGMTAAFPAMGESRNSRALYGVDVMLEIDSGGVEVKLTEVTFCPANNAVCAAYEKDEELYRNYNSDIFNCMFRGVVSDSSICRL